MTAVPIDPAPIDNAAATKSASNARSIAVTEQRAARAPLQSVVIWCACSLLSAALIGALAALSQHFGFAPAILFPIVVGSAIGSIVALIARACGTLRITAALVAVACMACLLTLAVQDGVGYLFYRQDYERELAASPQLAIARTVTGEFDAADFWTVATKRLWSNPWWIVDATLTVTAGATACLLLQRKQLRTEN
jgi:hypothetical protein